MLLQYFCNDLRCMWFNTRFLLSFESRKVGNYLVSIFSQLNLNRESFHERNREKLVSRDRRFDIGREATNHSFIRIRDANKLFQSFFLSRHTVLFPSFVYTCTGRACVCTSRAWDECSNAFSWVRARLDFYHADVLEREREREEKRESIVCRIYDSINLNRVTSGKNYSFISVAGS